MDVSDEDIISSTPTQTLPATSSKINRTKNVYNKNNINSLVYYPGEFSRPKHPSALKTRNYDESKQVEVNFLRMICEITNLYNKTFRFPNVRTVGAFILFKNLHHLKDNLTGHRIELDFSCQFYDKMPQLFSSIMILGTIKHKSFIKDNEKIFVPYIVVKTWEEWSGKVNFQEFYYNARRYRSPQVDKTVSIEEEECSSDDDVFNIEDFEKDDYFDKSSNNCSMSSAQDFEKSDFLNNLEKGLFLRVANSSTTSVDVSMFDKSEFL